MLDYKKMMNKTTVSSMVHVMLTLAPDCLRAPEAKGGKPSSRRRRLNYIHIRDNKSYDIAYAASLVFSPAHTRGKTCMWLMFLSLSSHVLSK